MSEGSTDGLYPPVFNSISTQSMHNLECYAGYNVMYRLRIHHS